MSWDSSKPVTGSDGLSAEVRANFQAIEYAAFLNLFGDPDFLIWPGGDSAVPGWWRLSGTGATIARETSTKKGRFAAKLGYGSAEAKLYQELLSTDDWANITTILDDQAFTVGARVWSDSTDCKLFIDDGNGTPAYSAAHPGTSSWATLTVGRNLAAASDRLIAGLRVNATGYGILDSPAIILGEVLPKGPLFTPISRGILAPQFSGDPLAAGTGIWEYEHVLPFLVEHVQLISLSNAVGQAMIVDVNHWDGSAWQSMFSTRPQIGVGVPRGGAAPDGTYRYRCFLPCWGPTKTADSHINIDVDQAASSGAKNPIVRLGCMTYLPPLLRYRNYGNYK